jgi:hypothetical protein
MDPSAVSPDVLFGHAGTLALAGWVVLALGIALRAPLLRDGIAGLVIPLMLSTLYTALVAIHWWSAEGGYGGLDQVAALFRSEGMLLAGWVHYLAFDLFVGAWIARDAAGRGVPRWLMIPILPLTFLFGPVGLLAWLMIRTAVGARERGALKESLA